MAQTAPRLTIDEKCFNLGYMFIVKHEENQYHVEHHTFSLHQPVTDIGMYLNYDKNRLIFIFCNKESSLGSSDFNLKNNAEHLPAIFEWAMQNHVKVFEQGNRPKSLDKYFN